MTAITQHINRLSGTVAGLEGLIAPEVVPTASGAFYETH